MTSKTISKQKQNEVETGAAIGQYNWKTFNEAFTWPNFLFCLIDYSDV